MKEKDFVVNHDRIKLREDRTLPLWIKRLQRDPELWQAAKTKKSASDATLHCFCRKPEEGFMIKCDYCLVWYHGPCVNVTPAMSKRIDKYGCPKCRDDPAFGASC